MSIKLTAIDRLLSVSEDDDPPAFLGPAGEVFRFTRRKQTTNNRYLMAKSVIPSGAGPHPHIHLGTNEWFYTPEEGISLFVGDNSYKSHLVVPGVTAPKSHLNIFGMSDNDLRYVPEGTVHGFVNNTRHDRELYFIWTHSSNDNAMRMYEYFDAVGEKISEKGGDLTPLTINKIKFVSEAPRYGIMQSTAFWEYVSSVSYASKSDDDASFEYLIRLLDEGDAKNPA